MKWINWYILAGIAGATFCDFTGHQSDAMYILMLTMVVELQYLIGVAKDED